MKPPETGTGRNGIISAMASPCQECKNENAKIKRLRASLREIGSAAVAFSSGVDSTFLLRAAHEELGDKAVAVTVRSQLIPRHELDEAAAFCRQEGIRHEIIDFDALSAPAVIANPPDRCYHCKKEVFGQISAFARAAGSEESNCGQPQIKAFGLAFEASKNSLQADLVSCWPSASIWNKCVIPILCASFTARQTE